MMPLFAAAAIQAAATGFAPPLDRALTYTISETRVAEGATQRFTVDRRVTFGATADGFVATVETLAVDGDAGRAGRMFEAMARALIGRRVTLHLDRSGKVVAVDDSDAIWAAQVDAMAATLSHGNAAQAAAVAALIAPLRSLSPAAKVARLGEMVGTLIAVPAPTPSAAHPVTLPAQGQDGGQALLAGSERVDIQRDGAVLLERRADGVVAGVPTAVVQRRRIDPRSGLVAEAVTITTIDAPSGRLIVTRSTVVKSLGI